MDGVNWNLVLVGGGRDKNRLTGWESLLTVLFIHRGLCSHSVRELWPTEHLPVLLAVKMPNRRLPGDVWTQCFPAKARTVYFTARKIMESPNKNLGTVRRRALFLLTTKQQRCLKKTHSTNTKACFPWESHLSFLLWGASAFVSLFQRMPQLATWPSVANIAKYWTWNKDFPALLGLGYKQTGLGKCSS